MNTNSEGAAARCCSRRKCIRIADHERGQMLNYLRITKLRVGVLLNFKHAKLEWERIVL